MARSTSDDAPGGRLTIVARLDEALTTARRGRREAHWHALPSQLSCVRLAGAERKVRSLQIVKTRGDRSDRASRPTVGVRVGVELCKRGKCRGVGRVGAEVGPDFNHVSAGRLNEVAVRRPEERQVGISNCQSGRHEHDDTENAWGA